MSKDNILFALVGLLLGFIVGFMFTNFANQRGVMQTRNPAGAGMQQSPSVPADHPPLQSNGVADQSTLSGMNMADVQAALKKAKDEPNNFDAQMKAATLYTEIKRYDQATEYLTRASKLKPNDIEPIVQLGNVNFDAGKYDDAERYYTTALNKEPNNVNIRTDLGLTFLFRNPPDVDRSIAEFRKSLERDPKHEQTLQNLTVALLQKGDGQEAKTMLAKLEAVNPNNPVLKRLRSDMESGRAPLGDPGSQNKQ